MDLLFKSGSCLKLKKVGAGVKREAYAWVRPSAAAPDSGVAPRVGWVFKFERQKWDKGRSTKILSDDDQEAKITEKAYQDERALPFAAILKVGKGQYFHESSSSA